MAEGAKQGCINSCLFSCCFFCLQAGCVGLCNQVCPGVPCIGVVGSVAAASVAGGAMGAYANRPRSAQYAGVPTSEAVSGQNAEYESTSAASSSRHKPIPMDVVGGQPVFVVVDQFGYPRYFVQDTTPGRESRLIPYIPDVDEPMSAPLYYEGQSGDAIPSATGYTSRAPVPPPARVQESGQTSGIGSGGSPALYHASPHPVTSSGRPGGQNGGQAMGRSSQSHMPPRHALSPVDTDPELPLKR